MTRGKALEEQARPSLRSVEAQHRRQQAQELVDVIATVRALGRQYAALLPRHQQRLGVGDASCVRELVPSRERELAGATGGDHRSEEHTSELQSPCNLV